MNICFFIGKIISEIKFDFILNGSVIKVKGYNEIADYCYSTLKQGMNIQIEGNINGKSETILEDIEIFN